MSMRVRDKSRLLQGFTGFLLVASLCCVPGTAQAEIQCFDCHGTRNTVDSRPVDAPIRDIWSGGFQGNHRSHVPSGNDPSGCEPCHPGSSGYTSNHRDGRIQLAPNINASPHPGRYGSYSTPLPQTPVPTLSSCTNVNCHFEASTPAWGSAPLGASDCTVCHASPPDNDRHGRKHGQYYGIGTASCNKCHPDHTAEASPQGHALEAGTRGLDVRFTTAPNTFGTYSGNVAYPNFLPSRNPTRDGVCSNLYCHSNGAGGGPMVAPRWSGPASRCYFCHKGKTSDNTPLDCVSIGGTWDAETGVCSPFINMTSNGHARLVGAQWVRKYPCTYCHNATVSAVTDSYGKIVADGEVVKAMHVNGTREVAMAPQWSIVGRPAPSYDPVTKVCDNVYCHSDGTTDPDLVKPFAWTERKTDCNSCHGHPSGSCSNVGCHDGRTDVNGNIWTVKTGWPVGEEWKASIPMFPNQGPGTARANSHGRHTETNFTCDHCHATTVLNGVCTDCHTEGIPPGQMSEVAHINPAYHVNKTKDVMFKDGGSYDAVTKTCRNTVCHTAGNDPIWGGSVNSQVVCLSCHASTSSEVDSFSIFAGTKATINLTEWVTTGHGRPTTAGPYPASGNPAANFPGNPCWYCHDNNVFHNDATNPFRLRKHTQFANRFEKECVYCHMSGEDAECLGCHNAAESLAPQLGSEAVLAGHGGTTYLSGCMAASCHDTDARLHKSGAGFWTAAQKDDVRNQYLMMGVCLKCHDEDSGNKCTSCHAPPENNPYRYTVGFDPGTGFIKPQKAKASSVHFGYKHYREYQSNGIWKGGKFCWDCHDPHGDSNIFMVQAQVATSTDGTIGIPQSRAAVVFTRKQSGLDYVKMTAPYNGICNVCHSGGSQHYRADGGDGHNSSRVCTGCHEHRFSDSHADNQPCNTCHQNKPVPRHSVFGLPRDCTKCHTGTLGKRTDVMGQFAGTSHHIQGAEVTNKQCYSCHWESTPDGLIDIDHHQGYNYKSYSTVKNAPVDLVVWGPGTRPTAYRPYSTAISFLAANVSFGIVSTERKEVAKITPHCLSCHSDRNNNFQPFGDCKTPRQYAWDKQSIAARYSQQGTTPWGKYPTNGKSSVAKALSAHGNAVANQGGFSTSTGIDGAIPNTRAGSSNVECFDCHNSHGTRVVGTTSSYVTFNGTKNGGNLKETQAGKGGYAVSYMAAANTASGSINPYNAGAGQCFDCHMTQTGGTTPWGYQSTFGATAPIKGYMDSLRFGQATAPFMDRYPYKIMPIKGGHLHASAVLESSPERAIDGLCTPCHDPHGVSPTMGSRQAYGVPLLKGTWMTSPYKEDASQTTTSNYQGVPPTPYVFTDQRTFGGSRIGQDDATFAGLCLRCHQKAGLTDGTNKNQAWKSIDRVHESVKGWGANTEHSYPCSKCHASHNTGLPRLMVTNCLDPEHRGRVASGGVAGWGSGDGYEGPGSGSFPRGEGQAGVNCHPAGAWPDNSWNRVTPW